MYNKDQDFDILSFEFEMPAQDNVVRNMSALGQMDTRDLYSVDEKLDDSKFDEVESLGTILGQLPLYLTEVPGTVDEIYNTIMDFIQTRKLVQRKRGLVITIDHTLLTKGKQGEGEKQVVDALCKMFVQLKKECINMGMKIIIVMLTQLNRGIEGKDRVTNPMLHYPTKNDIFASSSVFHSSDYVLISHKPANINGIDQFYGPSRGTQFPKGLPVFNPYNPDQAMIYWHLIKNRFGEGKILLMLDNFQYAKVDEFNPDIYDNGSNSEDSSDIPDVRSNNV